MSVKNTFDIYTDGGYFEKKDIGGWGWVIYKNNQELSRGNGFKKQTSSLEMELFAAQQAIQTLENIEQQPRLTKQITLHTDSKILIEGLTEKYSKWCQNNWKVKSGKTVVFKELWQQLFDQREAQNIELKWVKGHNGNQGNILADQLARMAVESHIKQ